MKIVIQNEKKLEFSNICRRVKSVERNSQMKYKIDTNISKPFLKGRV